MEKKLKVGFVGLGGIASGHLTAVAESPLAEIAGLCDVSEETLAKRGREFKVAALFSDYMEMLNNTEIDAVVISTPNAIHKEVAIASLRSGRHVFCEKPITATLADAIAIREVAKSAKAKLQIGMCRRFQSASAAIRRLVQSGELGDIYHIKFSLRRQGGIPLHGAWFMKKELSGGGVVVDLAVHSLDLGLWCADMWDPVSASCICHTRIGADLTSYVPTANWPAYDPKRNAAAMDVEEFACGLVRFGKGRSLQFELSWALHGLEENIIEIFGNKGGVRMGTGEPIRLFKPVNGLPAVTELKLPLDKVSNYKRQIDDFLESIVYDRPVQAPIDDGVTVMAIIDALYRSAESNRDANIEFRR